MTTTIHPSRGQPGVLGRITALEPDRVLTILQAFLAVGAIPGGVYLAFYPLFGGDLPFEKSDLWGTPFASYLIPGLFLLVAIGGGATLAAVLHLRRSNLAPLVSASVGLALAGFEAVEMMTISFHFLQALYFLYGLALIGLDFACYRPRAAVHEAMAQTGRRFTWPVAAVLFAAFLGLYALFIHGWIDTWGVAGPDQQAVLPGDELKTNPAWITTRGITINAGVDTVWAWLIQHGQDRAGFYSYDWLENLTGANIHNADSLHPEWQRRGICDGIPMARAYTGSRFDFTVVNVERSDPGSALVTTAVNGDVGIRALEAIDSHTTKLILRDREGTGSPSIFGRAYRWLVWDPMHGIMQRGMLIGLKARAEGNLGSPALMHRVADAGWVIAGLALAAVFAMGRRYRLWLVAPLLFVTPAIVLGHDPQAALAGFLAAGITTAGAVRWGWRWWSAFAVLGALVLLVLLLTLEAYVAFGLLFWGVLLWAAMAWLLVERPWTRLDA